MKSDPGGKERILYSKPQLKVHGTISAITCANGNVGKPDAWGGLDGIPCNTTGCKG